MIAGYFGGMVDAVIMRLVDIQMSIPVAGARADAGAVLSPSLSTVVIVIVVSYWTWYARIIRSEILSLKERDYVALRQGRRLRHGRRSSSAISCRTSSTRCFVLATLQIGQVIMFEARVSFLGLGIQMPDVSWGLMLADARQLHHQCLVGDHHARHRDHADLPVLEPDRRLAARHVRSKAPADVNGHALSEPVAQTTLRPLLQVENLQTHLTPAPRRGEGRRRREPRSRRRRDARHRRRVRVGQDDDLPVDPAAAAQHRRQSITGRIELDGANLLELIGRGDGARLARAADLDDLAGPAHLAQSGLHRRRPGWGALPLSQPRPRTGRGARRRRQGAAARPHPVARARGSTIIRISSPAACASASFRHGDRLLRRAC